MYIREVTIENIRRFGSGDSGLHLELPPAGWIVVAGPNGAGKTTFLQVLALGISQSFSDEYAGTLFSFLKRGEKHGTSRLVLASTTEDRFENDLGAEDPERELVIGDDWKIGPGHAMSHGRESNGQRAFAGPWHDNPRGWFAAGYGAFRNIMGRAGATPEAWTSAMTRESAFLTLFHNNELLNLPIRWLMDLDYRSIDTSTRVDKQEQEQAKQLRDTVIAMLNTGLLDRVKVLRVDSKGLWVEKDGVELPITRIGSGVQTLIALVADMIRHIGARCGGLKVTLDDHGSPRIENGGVVLIDEAEQHLHPAWQRRIGFWFKKHFPNIQFIVTTHSPFVCQAATEKGLILLPGDSGQPAVIADDRLYQQVVYGSVDDALLSGLFGLHRTWSDNSEVQRERFANLETKVLAGQVSAEERAEYVRLKEKLPLTMSDEINRVAARFLQNLDPHQ